VATEALSSAPAVVGRLSWMIVGPFALALAAVGISERRDGWFGALDLIYFVVLGGMLLGRWLEFQYSRPLTATGEPAGVHHLRRYALVLGALGLGAWLAANLIGNQAPRVLG
jgi:hypothetical protein